MRATATAAAVSATDMNRAFLLSFVVLAAYVFYASGALAGVAAEDTPMGDVICDVVSFIYGNLGRGLASLAIIILGVGATLGKVSWGLAITVAVGISVIFNAWWITNALTGGYAC